MRWEIYRQWMLWNLVRRIRKHGWTGMYVHEGVDAPCFSYSIVFWERIGPPEVIMFGMAPQSAAGLLSEAYAQLQDGRLTLADMTPWTFDDWEGGPALMWRAVHQSQIRREHFNIAIWYRERQGRDRAGLSAYQLLCTDRGGKFPWEDGFDCDYRPRQEPLYLPYGGAPDGD